MSVDKPGLIEPTASPASPWLRWYDPGVPSTLEVPDLSLPHFLATNAVQHRQRSAIRFFGRSVSYGELDDAVNRFANALRELGVEAGDRVALLLPNCPQTAIAFYGTLRAGAVVVPTSPLSVEGEMQHMWNEAQTRVVVSLSSFYPRVEVIRNTVPSIQHVIVTNIKEYLPPVTRLLFTVAKERQEGHRVNLPRDGRTHWFRSLMDGASPRAPQTQVRGDALALLQPTGGTTGIPKLAMLTHRNLLANARQVRVWFERLATPNGPDVVLGVVPLFHIYGVTTVLNYSLVHGGTMLLQPQFRVKDVLRALDREKPQFFPGIPTMYVAINNAPNAQHNNMRSLKAAISGAAPLPQHVQSRFEQLTGAKLVEGYGLTEASPVTHCNPLEGKRKVGSIGVPLPATEAAVRDQEAGTRVLPPGEVGELVIRGPQVMRGYWRREEETAGVLKDGWLFTGDLATMDEDGYFRIVDRKKDVIITGGMKVFPREVEEVLYAHPKVRKVAAVGVPDDKWGESVKVYIVLKDEESATADEIADYCRGKMGRYKVPRHIEFRSDLPETLIGKVLRRKLLEEEATRAAGGHRP